MNVRLLLLAALLMGCESYATRTRSSASGGAYVLTLARAGDAAVQSATRDVLGDIRQQCRGKFEVVSIEAVHAERDHQAEDGIYLDAEDHPVSGPYRTMIAYECRAPLKTDLNHRLYVLAGPTLRVDGHYQPIAQKMLDEGQCYETWACPVGEACEPKPCDE
jgi:hypothetical protein